MNKSIANDIELVQGIYQAYEIPSEAQDHIWKTIAEFCLDQLAKRKGPFFDAVKREKLLAPKAKPAKTILAAAEYALGNGWSEADIITVLTGVPRDGQGNPLPWCHVCNEAIRPEQELHTPEERHPNGVKHTKFGCIRCLTFYS